MVTRQSVAACFLATIGPGILLIIMLCTLNWLKMRKHPDPAAERMNFRRRVELVSDNIWKAFPALMLPVIILGGIYGGIFTPTEAAAVAVVYSIPVGWFIYRELNVRKIARCMVEAAAT
ncbi:C4-dicarboxylate ABC transporter permease, partial [Pseudomonas congelans]